MVPSTVLELKSLRLRGGAIESFNVQPEAQKVPPIKEYAPEESSESAGKPLRSISKFALDVVRIQVGLNTESFAPLFAHQVFGKSEEIVGYENPSVTINYTADSLVPTIIFCHRGLILTERNISDGINITDVVGSIMHKVPADYIAPQPWTELACLPSCFRPPGTLLCDYNCFSIAASKPKRQLLQAAAEAAGIAPSDMRYEIYQCCPARDAETACLVRRTQSLATWLINSVPTMDLADANWTCLLLYQSQPIRPTHAKPRIAAAEESQEPWHTDPAPRPGGGPTAAYALVGFATLHRFAACGPGQPDLAEVTPLHVELAARGGALARLRLAQLVVLPPHARRGHGAALLRAVHALARRDDDVVDVTVAEPTPAAFAALRGAVDAALVREAGLLSALRDPAPRWGEAQRATRLSMLRLFDLADALGCEVAPRGVRLLPSAAPPPGAAPPDGADGPEAPASGEDEAQVELGTVAGVRVDMGRVYRRAAGLGFSRAELDDLLHAIDPSDLAGCAGDPRAAADRLVHSVALAVAAAAGDAEGLDEGGVEELLRRVDARALIAAASPRAAAEMLLPVIQGVKALRGGGGEAGGGARRRRGG